ncbi:hypothetical protein [Oerskovia enterophila]|uniref:hypothetical protein n=1 Tax=Oerskovia enterophila TaxID=43678 RepID=UPI0033990D78
MSTEPYDPEVDPDADPDSLNPRTNEGTSGLDGFEDQDADPDGLTPRTQDEDEPQVGDDPTGFDD